LSFPLGQQIDLEVQGRAATRLGFQMILTNQNKAGQKVLAADVVGGAVYDEIEASPDWFRGRLWWMVQSSPHSQ
jgi:hypothetical protein